MRAVVLVVMLVSTVASASPAAEKLFRDGKQLMKAGKLAEACDAFRKSQELEPRSGALLNLGDCEEKRGRIATAWELFVASRELANQRGETARAGEAEKRMTAVASKLPYLTVHAPADRPAGFIVKRDGKEVPSAELDREVPIDPGRYELEASAPGHTVWKQSVAVVIGQKAVIDIPALVADPSATTTTTITQPDPVVAPTGPVTAPAIGVAATSKSHLTGKHLLGVGVAVGLSSDNDVIYGVRTPFQIASVGPGAIRVVPSLFYATFDNPADSGQHFYLYALGLGLEYVAPLAPSFFIAAGAGFGVDLISDSYDNPGQEQAWGAARLSPTLRVAGVLDVGLHLQLVKTAQNTVALGSLGVDYFFY